MPKITYEPPKWVELCDYDERVHRSCFCLPRLWTHGYVWYMNGRWFWRAQISGDQDEWLGAGRASSEKAAKACAVRCVRKILEGYLEELKSL